MKRKSIIILALSLLGITNLFAQPSSEDPKKKMEFFDMMVGEWHGIAIETEKEGKEIIYQHENVQYKLNGILIVVEGTGKNEKNEVVFNAFGNIFYDELTNQYKLYAFLDNGRMTEALIEIIDANHFKWSFSPNEFTHIRYETSIVDDVWIEKGYYSKDKENWVPIFEMELKKIK